MLNDINVIQVQYRENNLSQHNRLEPNALLQHGTDQDRKDLNTNGKGKSGSIGHLI
jgi:hypothetical protein